MHFQIVFGLLSISVALLEALLQPELVRGYPCIRRNNQIYCPTPGSKLLQIDSKPDNTTLRVTAPYLPATNLPGSLEVRNVEPKDIPSTPPAAPKTATTTYYMYYTKKTLEEHLNDQNSVQTNEADIEENVMDGGDDHVLKRVKRERIEKFIDENKALIRRMFGEYHASDDGLPDVARDHYTSYTYGTGSDGGSASSGGSGGQAIHKREKRAKTNSYTGNKIDSCESAVEIVTPYWASNSGGKIRAIVNTQHLQQAIQQEVCQSVQTKRCNDDCTCEQKYKWHRLLAYDPDDDCKGIFMDWFLFPSCCVCRCAVL